MKNLLPSSRSPFSLSTNFYNYFTSRMSLGSSRRAMVSLPHDEQVVRLAAEGAGLLRGQAAAGVEAGREGAVPRGAPRDAGPHGRRRHARAPRCPRPAACPARAATRARGRPRSRSRPARATPPPTGPGRSGSSAGSGRRCRSASAGAPQRAPPRWAATARVQWIKAARAARSPTRRRRSCCTRSPAPQWRGRLVTAAARTIEDRTLPGYQVVAATAAAAAAEGQQPKKLLLPVELLLEKMNVEKKE